MKGDTSTRKRETTRGNAADSSATDVLGNYLAGIGSYELLSAEQEVELAQRMEAGNEALSRLESGEPLDASERRLLQNLVGRGEAARRSFVEANLRLVVANARRYAGNDIEMVDLIQEGNLGLITAVEKFDWRKGFKFSTYATWWIRQAMQRARANLGDMIRLPARLHDALPVVRAAAETLQSKLGRVPTPEEIAEETGVDVDDVERALSVGSTVAIETPVGEDGATLSDFLADVDAIAPDTEVELRLAEDALREALAGLSPIQRRAVEMRYGLEDGAPATLSRISSEIDIPEHQLRPLIDEALQELAVALASAEEILAA